MDGIRLSEINTYYQIKCIQKLANTGGTKNVQPRKNRTISHLFSCLFLYGLVIVL